MGDEDRILADMQSEVERLQAQSDQNRIEFLRTEVGACSTFASVAETELESGNREHAVKSLTDAETAYTTMVQFMSDPKHAKHITEQERMELRAGMEPLRAALDKLGERLK